MSAQQHYYLHLAGRSLVLSATAYILTLGGTFNGILIVALQQVSLALLTAGVGLWLLVTWRRPLSSPFTPLDPALALWAAAYTISTLAHPSGRVEIGVWYAGLYAGIWIVLSDLRRCGLPGLWITDAALLTAIPLMLLALIQVAAWFPAWLALPIRIAFVPPRPPSALGNSNVLGAVLAMLIPFGLVRMRWSPRRPDRILWALWNLCTFLILYLTYSRGAWLAAACGLLVYGALALYRAKRLNPAAWAAGRRKRSRRAQILMAAVALAVSGAGVILLAATGTAFNTPRRETGSRLAFYEIAWQSFRDHPLAGTGPFTFGLTLSEHRSIPPDQPHAHAHNLMLNVAAETGLPGLAALAVTVLLILRQGWRRVQHSMREQSDQAQQAHIAACGAALAAFGAHQLVDMPAMFPAMMVLMLGILAAGIVPDRGDTSRATPNTASAGPTELSHYRALLRKTYRVAALALWGVLLITGWWSARVYADYIRGEKLLVQENYRQGAAVLRGTANAQPEIALYHAEYGYACGLLAASGDRSLLQPGIKAYQRALEMELAQAVWWANLAVLYEQIGSSSQALVAMQQAVYYAPDSPDLWFNLGVYEEMAGQTGSAREAYRRVLDLNPAWGNTGTWTASALRREVLDSDPVPPTPYRQAVTLWQAGQPAAALKVLQATIDHDPSQPGPYARIARLYVMGGDFKKARDYLDAAQVLAGNDQDRAWIQAVEAELALAQGDREAWQQHRQAARRLLWPDATGSPLTYGSDIAYYQFLRLRVPGTLLPPLTVLSPDPELVEQLR